jgi:hypothetical protein
MMDDFFEAVGSVAEQKSFDLSDLIRFGTVDAAYAGGAARPKVLFDGETIMGTKTYPWITAVVANDRVMMLRGGHTWVVLGKVH